MAQRPLRALIPALACGALLLGAAQSPQEPAAEPGRTLDAELHHLGDDETPDWSDVSATPEGLDRWEWSFTAEPNGTVRALAISARHVDGAWELRLNDTPLGRLRGGTALAEHHYPVPAGVLRADGNRLTLSVSAPGDDVVVGRVRLLDRGFRAIHRLRAVEVQVRDVATGLGVPARLVITGADGARPALHAFGPEAVPVRAGVAYADARGRAHIEVPAGEWRLWATRGTEWGVDSAPLTIEAAGAEPLAVRLGLRREVDTPLFLAADTHVHTLTFSGHGDASVDERVLSLAGQGVELAVATDHNHHTDYRPWMEARGLDGAYRAVVGNEVTTGVGHFNAFPLDPQGPLPDHELRAWPALVEDMRACGAEVVILNHPRWPDFERGPFGVFGLDRSTGSFAAERTRTVNAARVTVAHPGAAPAEIETGVVRRIEESVLGLAGVDGVTSVAEEGAGVVTVAFVAGADREEMLDEVRRAVDGIGALPQGAAKPRVEPFEFRKPRAPATTSGGGALTVDAIEIFNSTYADSWETVMEDWFALLNRGVHARGVGSSDSHTVGDVVGQGRTYVYAGTDDPLAAEPAELWRSFREGRGSMSMGLYLQTLVGGFRIASPLTPASGAPPPFRVRLAGAEWAQATRVRVWWNGTLVAERALEAVDGSHDRELVFEELPVPRNDGWIVCAADGPLPAGGWWDTTQEGVAAITNPVWVDVDGDGYESPREQAEALWDARRREPRRLGEALARRDAAVAMQVCSILLEEARGQQFRSEVATVFEHAGAHGPQMRAWWEEATAR